MARIQIIKCSSCGKVLGVLDATTGNFNAIAFGRAAEEPEKEPAGKDKPVIKTRADVAKEIEKRNGYRVIPVSEHNIYSAKNKDENGNEVQPTITCGCGYVNGLY